MRQEKMNMPKIKICGLSRPEDITYINEAKPDYCGFIIDVPKSRRNVSISKVRELVQNLESQISRSEYLSIKTAARSHNY